MCVIVVQPAGLELSGNKFRNCWNRNSDGGGFAYIADGEVVVDKGYFGMSNMLTQYRKTRGVYPDSPFLLHFRIATVGPVDGDNTHPFQVRDDLVMAHNGTISGFGNKEMSDSLDFAQRVLAALKPGWEEDEVISWLVEKTLGWSKIALLRNDGALTILNEDRGVWVDGLWFSNDSYKKVKFFGKKNAPPLVTQPVALLPGDDIDLIFLNQECVKCDKKLDYWDCELAMDSEATVPVCYDCVADFEDELIQEGLIADWMSDPQPLDDETEDGKRAYHNWLKTNEFYVS